MIVFIKHSCAVQMVGSTVGILRLLEYENAFQAASFEMLQIVSIFHGTLINSLKLASLRTISFVIL